MEKVSFLAQRAFQQRLFNDSIYGRITNEADFDSITIPKLKHFFQENYLNGLSKVVVVGNLNQDEIDEIIDLTGSWSSEVTTQFENSIKNLRGGAHIVKDGAVQTAIRVGKILFNKTHEDYNDFLILNTIFGDYFGSRLMSNIREDKGYTYGIGTMVAELHETGYFLIATEVGKDVKDATLKEIQFEMERLQTELVSDEELLLVKNYMLGQLLKSADGAYSMTDLYMSVEPYGLDLDFYNRSIESINKITPERIQELAQKYLRWNDMTVVSAG
jgi:predicted Zn-dependent peptidase